MSCHSVVWSDAPMLEPVRESYRSDRPIAWTRVHDLPDFAYFDHSIHVSKGIGCASCHGRVDQMPLAWREETLNMEWCLACHRAPERFVRPRDEVFDMEWEPPADRAERRAQAQELLELQHVNPRTDCSTCHR
jgi:hypothetical protein